MQFLVGQAAVEGLLALREPCRVAVVCRIPSDLFEQSGETSIMRQECSAWNPWASINVSVHYCAQCLAGRKGPMELT